MSERADLSAGAPLRPAYEDRDARPRSIGFWIAALAALVAVAFLVVRVLATSFERREAAREEPRHEMTAFRQPPAAPRLQANPRAELEAYQAAQRELLSTYGWIDPEQELVHIPIERAMQLVVERGLPVRERPEEER